MADTATKDVIRARSVFCPLLEVSADYSQAITGQVTEVTCPVIGIAQSEFTMSKIQKTGPGAPPPIFAAWYKMM